MAFGRSNSLSINTGATNSLFSQQNQNTGAAASQPQQTGGLFGSSTNQNTQAGGLFGANNNAPKPGLFGASTTTSQPQQSGGLFGGAPANNANPLGGSLFGTSTQQSQPQTSSGLFGSTLVNQSQNQSQGGQTGGGMFGNLNQNQNQANRSTMGGGMFGGLGQSQHQGQSQPGGGLFGSVGGQNRPQASMFGGSTAQQPNVQQPSLYGTAIFNNDASKPAMSLSMGQGNQPAQQTVPGTKIDISNIRPTTRFADLHDDLKKQIEQIDAFIKQQENFASQCEAMLPSLSDSVATVTPDVELISGKVETVELALENDSREIKTAKDLVHGDAADLTRCVRVVENQSLPSQFHYGPSLGGASSGSRNRPGGAEDDYDVDLIGYFHRQADAMQTTLHTFTSNLSEIESHLRVIESSTLQQSQQVAAQRAGTGSDGNDSVRELADTLRGFENGILEAAGFVGACREGVNDLILGRSAVDSGRSRYGRY